MIILNAKNIIAKKQSGFFIFKFSITTSFNSSPKAKYPNNPTSKFIDPAII